MLCVWLLVLGVIFWLVTAYVLPALPVPQPIKSAIVAILAVIVILMLLGWLVGFPMRGPILYR